MSPNLTLLAVIDVRHGDGIHIGFDATGATVGDVLTVDQYGAHWDAPGGAGGSFLGAC